MSASNQSGCHGGIGESVDQDEAPRLTVFFIGIEGDGAVDVERAQPDLVQGQLLSGDLFLGVNIDPIGDADDPRGNRPRTDLHDVASTGQERLIRHPYEGRTELIAHRGRFVRAADEIAARDIDLVCESQRDRLLGHCAVKVAVEGHDATDHTRAARRHDANGRTGCDLSARDGACEAAEIEVGTVHPLHRQAEGRGLRPGFIEFHGLEVGHQARPCVPGRIALRLNDVVPAHSRQGDGDDFVQAKRCREGPVFRLDFPESGFRIVDQIHLVDGEHNMPDPDERDEHAVPTRLHQHALARINQDDGKVSGGCPGDHVARVLLVAWRVRDNELAAVGRKESIGDIDGDALLALRSQSIEEQGVVEFIATRADLARVGFEGRQLVLEQHL